MVGSSPSTSTGAPQLSPSVVVIIVLITVVFFLSGFLHLLARCFARTSSSNNGLSRRNNSSGSLNSLQGQLQHLFHLHDSGVEQAFIDALPVFLYRAVRGLKDGADCAVCLNEFSGDDKLRLLPKCSHAFHIECIDTWLLSHSTCPLCRCSLLPDASGSSLGCTPAVLGGIRVDSFGASSVATTMTDSSAVVDCGTTDAQHNPAATHEVPPRVVPVKLGRLVPNPAAPGDESAVISCRRSYSMGSYEYVVTGEEQMAVLVVAPTPMHRKWKPPGTPGHRTALSECIPERGGSPWVTIDIDPRPMVDQQGPQRASLSWAPWRKKGSTASTVRDKSFNSDKMNSLSSFSFRLNADHQSTSEEQSSAVWWWKNRVTSEQHNGTNNNNNNNNNSSSWDQASICSTNAEMKSTGSAASSMASVSIVARRTLQWLMGRDRHRSSTEEIAH